MIQFAKQKDEEDNLRHNDALWVSLLEWKQATMAYCNDSKQLFTVNGLLPTKGNGAVAKSHHGVTQYD